MAIVDIDAHHGNGTQAIFYHRADVYYGSLHVDPGAGWFPHYVGYPRDGRHAGAGANRNLPLAPGTGDDQWLAALDQLCAEVAARGADALVVSLGVDAAASDPESPLQVTANGYRSAGERPGRFGPVVLVQEGGYDLPSWRSRGRHAGRGGRDGRDHAATWTRTRRGRRGGRHVTAVAAAI